jgi:hypothetical protein
MILELGRRIGVELVLDVGRQNIDTWAAASTRPTHLG